MSKVNKVSKMTVVASSGYRVTKTYGDRKYVLRAPAYGEVGLLHENASTALRPPPAVIMDEIKNALVRAGKPEMVDLVTSYEEAEMAMQDARMRHDGDTVSGKEAIGEARLAWMKTQQNFRRVEWEVRNDQPLRGLRALKDRMEREEHLALLALCLSDWSGEELPVRPDGPLTHEFINSAFPSCDIAALSIEAFKLISPAQEVVGN